MDRRDKHSIFSPEREAYLDQLLEDIKNPPTTLERIDRNLRRTREILAEIRERPISKKRSKDSKEE